MKRSTLLCLPATLLEDTELSGHDLERVICEILFYGAKHGHLEVIKLGLRVGKVNPLSADLRTEEFSGLNRAASSNGGPDTTPSTLQNGAQIGELGLCLPLAKAARGVQKRVEFSLPLRQQPMQMHGLLTGANARVAQCTRTHKTIPNLLPHRKVLSFTPMALGQAVAKITKTISTQLGNSHSRGVVITLAFRPPPRVGVTARELSFGRGSTNTGFLTPSKSGSNGKQSKQFTSHDYAHDAASVA